MHVHLPYSIFNLQQLEGIFTSISLIQKLFKARQRAQYSARVESSQARNGPNKVIMSRTCKMTEVRWRNPEFRKSKRADSAAR
jgi:hypothetical protein